MTNPAVIAELNRLARENGGMLEPDTVVATAADIRSVLHSFFEWDDSEAAARYRIQQARQLIRVCVKYVGPIKDSTPMRVFVSLSDDRRADGGYRVLADVLSDERMRSRLLQDALEEMRTFERKYGHLKEIARVIQEMNAAAELIAA